MAVENGVPENEDVKKKALLRLAVAGLVTATALGALWWLDRQKPDKPRARPEPALPAPIRPAPPAELAPPLPAPGEPTETAPTPEAAPQEGPGPAEAVPQEAPPPPRVSNHAPAMRPPAAAPAPMERAAPPRPAAPETPPQPGQAGGFVVRVGVFSNPDNARELVARLRKHGIRATMETRVHVGPFLDRAQAETAQAELRGLGLTPVVTPAAATR